MAAEVEIITVHTDNASGSLGGLAETFGNLGNIVTGIKSAFDLIGSAIDSVVGFVQPFIDSASESEQAVAKLEQVLVATGGAAGLTSQELQDMADRLQGVTMFSDEAILSGQSMLLTFRNIGEDTFPRATEAMLDMGQMFGSVDAAAVQLGKALNDPIAGISALQRIGVTFTEEQKEMIANFMEQGDIVSAQNVILSELEAQIGGVAEAMGDTFAGKMEIIKNRFDTLKESIGGFILNALDPLIAGVEDFLFGDWFQNFVAFFEDLTRYADAGVEPLAAIGYALNNMTPAMHDIAMYFLQLQDILREGGSFGDVIAKVFGDIDFSGLMQTVSDQVTGLDWTGFSQAIAEGISSIDWGRVGNVLAEGLGHLAIMIGTILGEIDWSALLGSLGAALADLMAGLFGFVDWDDMIANAKVGFRYVIDSIKASIDTWWGNTWGGMLDDVKNAFYTVVNWIKDFLGISSPSTVFYNIGRDIIQGLINGWNAFWGDLVDLATQSLDNFLNIFGIDLSFGGSSASGLGTAGGGTSGTGSTSELSGSGVVNNFYAPVYFQGLSSIGYDCPSPSPLVAASGNQLVTTGF